MAAGESFRNSNIQVGQALGELPWNVSLAADNTQINMYRYPFVRLTSNDTTPANRTFSLTNGAVDGQILHLVLVPNGAVTTGRAELVAGTNVSLTGGSWLPAVSDTLTLQWDQLSATWREVSRAGSISQLTAGIYTPTMTVGANVVSASALQGIYQRVGSVVYVSGASAVVTTLATNTASTFFVSLPIASNLAGITDLSGNANRQAATGTAYAAGACSADITNDRAQIDFNSTQTTSAGMVWTFSYVVL